MVINFLTWLSYNGIGPLKHFPSTVSSMRLHETIGKLNVRRCPSLPSAEFLNQTSSARAPVAKSVMGIEHSPFTSGTEAGVAVPSRYMHRSNPPTGGF